MTLYMLFAGIAIVIQNGVAAARLSSAQVASSNGSEAAEVGRALFQGRGCVDCHEPELCGVGPSLDGLFGSAVRDPVRGVTIVDESYVREAILNPSATVALGYPPMMPTFAGQLTEEELQALIAYIKSLSVAVHVQRPKGVSP